MPKTGISPPKVIQQILVPTDFSETSHNAFEYAVHIAEMLDAKLVLLHVYQDISANLAYMPATFVSALREEKIEKAYAHLDEYLAEVQQHVKKEVRASSYLRSGRSAPEIVQAADKLDVDLIIMGTQGAKSPSEHILGSIAAEVIQRADCPVLAVPNTVTYQPLRNIMYALGLESNDPAVIKDLNVLTEALGANLICTNVRSEEAKWQSIDWTCLEKLEEWESEGKLAFSVYQTEDIVQGLKTFVADHKVDLLAMKTHKYPIGMGKDSNSLTRKMLLETKIPLLAFHDR